jgi:hypothetical protein
LYSTLRRNGPDSTRRWSERPSKRVVGIPGRSMVLPLGFARRAMMSDPREFLARVILITAVVLACILELGMVAVVYQFIR